MKSRFGCMELQQSCLQAALAFKPSIVLPETEDMSSEGIEESFAKANAVHGELVLGPKFRRTLADLLRATAGEELESPTSFS